MPPEPNCAGEAWAVRAIAFVLSILLVAPFVTALAPAAPVAAPALPVFPPPLPADLSDGDLVMLLAADMGHTLTRAPPIVVPEGTTVSGMVLKLGARSGATMTPADAAVFETLDPRVAGPVLTLLVAVDVAWDMNDAALANVDDDERARLTEALLAGDYHLLDSIAALTPSEEEVLLREAILLLDTIEAIVVPQLEQAVADGAWPPVAVADPVGVLRLGSPGNDYEPVNRMIQLDPSGDDRYRNNAGGSTFLADSKPATLDYPVAVSLDFAGNDDYWYGEYDPALGAAAYGVGIALDFRGDDRYGCATKCMGAGFGGVGLMRDHAGSDDYFEVAQGLGGGTMIGIVRDDEGNDSYHPASSAGGYVLGDKGRGILWDRAGKDYYESYYSALNLFGVGALGGQGWFVDEGPEVETYWIREVSEPIPHACNTCTWSAGQGQPTGRGNDNHGGLSYLLAHQA